MNSVLYSLESVSIRGVSYQGLLHSATPRSRGLVMHLHGTGGDFFSNDFIQETAKEYAAQGFSFLTANLVGCLGESALEDFTQCVPAIDAWLRHVPETRCIILQGHSLGALKALHYLRDSNATFRHLVKGLVLLSPFDVVAFYCKGDPARVGSLDKSLNAIIASGKAEEPVGKELFDLWPISARTMRQLIQTGGPADRFPSRSDMLQGFLEGISIPVLVGIGGSDFASYPSPAEVISKVPKPRNSTNALIPDAPHNFAGRIPDLIDALHKWLIRTFED